MSTRTRPPAPPAAPPARRRVAPTLVGVGLLAVVVLVLVRVLGGGGGPDARTYRVDAIFDVARGIAPRQVVKVAGAEVGTVVGVRLTPDYKARVEMRIDRRFGPFRRDASCAILAEGVISENFVDCRPGTPAAPPLPPAGGARVATVPVARTSAPVSLQDLLDLWRVPTAERLTALVDELGIGLSGRGEDVSAILYRAAPALAATRRAIATVNGQRAELQHLVTAAAPVLRRLAERDGDVRAFLDRTARLTRVTGSRAGAVAQAVRRLPPLLAAAEPALRELDATATTATPLLRALQTSAPGLSRLTRELPPFTTTATTALRELDAPLRRTAATLRDARPVTRLLASFARDADPAGLGLARLLTSLRDAGAIESVLHGLYSITGLTTREDATSHIVLGLAEINQCVIYARTPTPGCSARLDGGVTPSSPIRRRLGGDRRPTGVQPAASAPAPTSTAPAASPTPTTPSITTPVPATPPSSVGRLLDFLLG